jgi:hypothetical protein
MFEHTSNLRWGAELPALDEENGVNSTAATREADPAAQEEEEEEEEACTSLAWKKQQHDPKRMILAQNWDWTARVKPNLCLMSIFQEGKPRIWMVTEVSSVQLTIIKLEKVTSGK